MTRSTDCHTRIVRKWSKGMKKWSQKKTREKWRTRIWPSCQWKKNTRRISIVRWEYQTKSGLSILGHDKKTNVKFWCQMSKSKLYFRLDDSYSLDSQIESLRDVHEKHQLEKSMKMPRHIGYGEKSRSRDSSFYGAGSKHHEYHPWPLIEGIELNMWCAFDLLTIYSRVACLLATIRIHCCVKWFLRFRPFYWGFHRSYILYENSY